MNKGVLRSIVLCLVCLTFVSSCVGSLPKRDEYVEILLPSDKEIAYEEMVEMLAKHGIEIPSLEPTPGTVYHAVVIPFDIADLKPRDVVTYDEVSVTVSLSERTGTAYSEDTANIQALAAIPHSVDRNISVEEASKLGVSVATDLSELLSKSGISGNFSADRTVTESYTRLYRQVTSHIRRSSTLVSWAFAPFKDEPIFAGTYYVIALIAVHDPTREFRVDIESNCSYRMPVFFGLWDDTDECKRGTARVDMVPAEQPKPPSPPEDMVLVYGGQQWIRDAVLGAVDWQTLMTDQNISLVFQDLAGERIDLPSQRPDLARCRESLAEAGYPDGYPDLRLMVWPASDLLIQVAQRLAGNLADCALGVDIEMVHSYQDAYSRLSQRSMAGEAGLLLSTPVEE